MSSFISLPCCKCVEDDGKLSHDTIQCTGLSLLRSDWVRIPIINEKELLETIEMEHSSQDDEYSAGHFLE